MKESFEINVIRVTERTTGMQMSQSQSGRPYEQSKPGKQACDEGPIEGHTSYDGRYRTLNFKVPQAIHSALKMASCKEDLTYAGLLEKMLRSQFADLLPRQ